MVGARELAATFRARAADYERQATAALTPEAKAVLQKTANRYRTLAGQIEQAPPRWTH